MMLTPHVLVGVAIATSIPNPAIAIPLSFFMHFLGDRVPHWDFYSGTTKEERVIGWRPLAVMADMGIGIAVGMFFTLYALWVVQNNSLAFNIFGSGVASVLPDVLTGPTIYFVGKKFAFLTLISKIQSKMQFQAPLPWGVITQVIVSVLSLLLIYANLQMVTIIN